jgi:hypothetical protein
MASQYLLLMAIAILDCNVVTKAIHYYNILTKWAEAR